MYHHKSEVPDWRMWAVSGDTDDGNSPVLRGSLPWEVMEELVCGRPRLG